MGLGFILMIIFSSTSRKKVTDKAAIIAKNKPGFDKFFKSYQGGGSFGWPAKVPRGRKFEEFMSMIGQPAISTIRQPAKAAPLGKTAIKRKPSSCLTIGIVSTTIVALVILGISAKNGSLRIWISSIFPLRSCEAVDANYYTVYESDCSDSNGNTKSGYQWCFVTLRSGGGGGWNLHGQSMTTGDQAQRWIPNECIH